MNQFKLNQMSKNKIYTLAIIGLIFTTISSCKKDSFKAKNSPAVTNVKIEEETILGKKKKNPFEIKVMREAYSNLSKNKSNGNNLEPNKLYVRFLPQTAEETKILEDQNLILSDIPLDQEVVQYGSSYQDPSTNGTTWLYTTVDANYTFGSITHEIIDSLFLPNDVNGNKSTNLFKDFTKDELVDKALELTDNKDEISESNEKVQKYNPEGYVRVHQRINSSYTPVPVKNIKVRSRWWFDYGTAYTDANGHFYISEQYRKNRNVNIIFIFENENVNIRTIKGSTFLQMFFTERNNIGEYENSALENINYLFTDNPTALNTQQKRFWIAAHAINSVYEQREYCQLKLINKPPQNLNMWITNENASGISLSKYAAAPMFHIMSDNSLLLNFTQAVILGSGHPLFAVVIQLFQIFSPDITYNYSSNNLYYEFSDDITQIFYHELCHASHFTKLTNAYWLQLGLAELTNGNSSNPYGEPDDWGAGRIALCESWAEFCSAEFAHIKYGTVNSFPYGNVSWMAYIERFRPFPPFGSWNWIPDGVMHDLMDDSFEPGSTTVIDNAYGFSIQQIFNSLDNDVTTIQEYKTRFVQETGTWQVSEIAQLYKSYGY